MLSYQTIILLPLLGALADTAFTLPDTCGGSIIGSNVPTAFSASNTKRLYLNTAKPAQCSGMITALEFCYYGPSKIQSNRVYQATVAVYRPVSGSNAFRRVSDVMTISRMSPSPDVTPDNAILSGFNCNSHNLTATIDVQARDVIGACIFDPKGKKNRQLDLVAESPGGEGYSMMYKDEAAAGCDVDVLPETVTDLQADQVLKVLHIYAQITPYLTTVSPSTNSGYSIIQPASTNTVVQIPDSMTTSNVTAPNSLAHTTYTSPHNSSTVTRKFIPVVISSTFDVLGLNPSTTRTRVDATVRETKMAVFPSTADAVPESPTERRSKNGDGIDTLLIAGVSCGVLLALLLVVTVSVIFLVVWRRKCSRYVRRRQKVLLNDLDHSSTVFVNSTEILLSINHTDSDATTSNHTTAELSQSQDYEELHASQQYATIETDITSGEEHFYYVLEGPNYPISKLLEKNKSEDIYEEVERYHEPADHEEDLYEQIKSFGIRNINLSSIQIQNHIGSGQFGSVQRGVWKTSSSEVSIALKSLGESTTTESRLRFLQEAAIMAQFRHPNIASLYGVVSKTSPVMLVVELVEKGDLSKYLKSLRQSPCEALPDGLPNLLLSFCQHVALGMQYLSRKGFIHRDLAARNILVSKDNVCKVADFGMSRELAENTYYISRGGEVPVKWTAPEAIHYKKYSTASDVWSYGCLLYEIWSLGHMPFENTDIFEVVKKVEEGVRLAPPPGCPRDIYEIMIKSWHPITSCRPCFREIVIALTEIQERQSLTHQDQGNEHSLQLLGSSVKDGTEMYKDLQERYIIRKSSAN